MPLVWDGASGSVRWGVVAILICHASLKVDLYDEAQCSQELVLLLLLA